MFPLPLWLHFPPIAGCTLYHVTIYVVKSLPTHNRVYSVPCYHRSWQFTSQMVTWYRVHSAMGGKWIHNFNGNMVQSTLCYGWEVNSQHKWEHGTEYTLLWVGREFTTSMVTWYRVHLVVNSLPTHSSVYCVPCYHWSCEFTSHP
jgi:hypothetical protein